jgi:hypothetical protein
MSKSKKKFDVVDVYRKLKKHFPHVKFVTEDVQVPIGRVTHTFHEFRLKKYNGQKFSPPLKTTISILKDDEITKEEFKVIRNNMIIAFGETQLKKKK